MAKPVATPDAFKKAVTKSLIIHLILLLLVFIGLPKFFMPEEQKPMDVVMVDITRGNSEELGDSPPDVKHLPDNTIQEQKNPMPEAKDVKTTAPQKVEVAPTPPVVSNKTMADPTKPVKKPQPTGVDSKMSAALAKINDQLNQRKITNQIAQSKGTEGYKYGNTDKPTNILNNTALISYRAMVKTKITRERLNLGQDGTLKTPIVVIRINSSGVVTSKAISRKSGSVSIDAAAIRAVERASPLPPPPESIREFVSTHTFTIEF